MADAEELLRKTRVEVAPATYFLIRLSFEQWAQLRENPELSPRGEAPFMFLRDDREITLLLDETDWRTMRHAVRDARVESDFRLLTLDIELPWSTIGYLALVTDILRRAGVSVGALSAFSRDHLLIKQNDLAKTLKVLGDYVPELC